jgi:dTDP-4-dehydrorhamnose reductase
VTFSSDLVFDGAVARPYTEHDTPRPLNVYGQSKALAESRVAGAHPGALIVRSSAFFGPWDEANFVTRLLHSLRNGEEFAALDDVVVSPTYVPDLVDASLDLLIDGERGLWHLANGGGMSWFEFGKMTAELAGLDAVLLTPRHLADLELPAQRPRFSALASDKANIVPSLEHAVRRYLDETGRNQKVRMPVSILEEKLGA